MFCKSCLLLLALSFCSTSALLYCSVLLQLLIFSILLFFNSFCSFALYFICSACPFLQYSYIVHFRLYLNSTSSLTPSPFSFSYYFILFPRRTTNCIQCHSFPFIHSAMTVPLPISFGKNNDNCLSN